MAIEQTERQLLIEQLIENELKPVVKKVDTEAYYPHEYLSGLGKAGLLQSTGSVQNVRLDDVNLIEETAQVCLTTAFNLWCHLASSTYLRKSGSKFLMSNVLPLLEDGANCGGTGLSNPMKYYAGLEKLCLKAVQVEDGYIISGQLPNVSNLGPNHSFGIIASVDDERRIMAFVPYDIEGLELREKRDFIGLNGSATYSCKFNDVHIPQEWIVSEHADSFVGIIRATFILYQIPLGLGIAQASIQAMERAQHKQGGCNQYLKVQPDQLQRELDVLREQTYALAELDDLDQQWHKVLRLRLDAAYFALNAVHASMLHCGGSAYLQSSAQSRRLREVYFLANLTPTIKHLEKMLHNLNS